MVHAAVAHAEPGDVLVLTMPDPTPVALVGDLLATQALDQGVAAMLVDGAVRDVDELRELGLPIWARYVRAQGATKEHVGSLDTPVVVGGARIDPGDVIVLDADGAVVVEGGPRRRRRRARRASARRASASSGPGTRRVSVPTTSTTSVGSWRGSAGRDARGRGARPRRGGRHDRVRSRCGGVCGARLGSRRRAARCRADRHTRPRRSTGAVLVLSLTTGGPRSRRRGERRAGALSARQLYADLNTTAPALKREVAAVIARTGAGFADVALLGPVPARGVATPALASGDGAVRFAELVRPLGMPVDVVGSEPGDAAGLKLLRSVFMKGLAASVLESVEAARRRGAEDWLRREVTEVIGEPLLERLLTGSVVHAERRHDEMDAAAAYLDELGVEPRVAAAAAGWLRELADEKRTRPG